MSENAIEMPDFDQMDFEELVAQAQFWWLFAQNMKGNCVDLDAELATANRLLKAREGELKTALNNFEAARSKVKYEKRELEARRRRLDERDALPPDEAWADKLAEKDAKLASMRKQRDDMKEAVSELRGKLKEIEELAR